MCGSSDIFGYHYLATISCVLPYSITQELHLVTQTLELLREAYNTKVIIDSKKSSIYSLQDKGYD